MRSLLLLLALLVGGSAAAQVVPDPRAGAEKAYTCLGCHGIPNYQNAFPAYRVPRIAGQNYPYLVSALNAYRDGTRKHPTMRAQAESLSDQDIADIAAYLAASGDGAGVAATPAASTPPPAPVAVAEPAVAAAAADPADGQADALTSLDAEPTAEPAMTDEPAPEGERP